MKLHSFSHRIINDWNELPNELQDLTVLTASNLHWKRTGKIRNLNMNSSSSNSVCEKFQTTRGKVAPVIFIYGSHFSATEAT